MIQVPEHRIRPVSWNQFVKNLQALGFEGPCRGGRHPFMVKGDLVLTIPNPHRSEICVYLLGRIRRQVGLSRVVCNRLSW